MQSLAHSQDRSPLLWEEVQGAMRQLAAAQEKLKATQVRLLW